MLISFWVLLFLLNLVRTLSAIEESSAKNETLADDACSNEILTTTFLRKLDQLEFANENLRLRMDTLNLIIIQQFTELKKTLKKGRDTDTATATNADTHQTMRPPPACFYSYGHLIDVRFGGEESNLSTSSLPLPSCHTSGFVPMNELPNNCGDAMRLSGRGKGIYKIFIPEAQIEPFYVYCDEDADEAGHAWTIVQRRRDGSVDFFRKWNDYVQGFGNLEGEFFIGLQKLHALTQSGLHELWIELQDFDNVRRWAKYSSFAVAGANQSYALTVLGSYTGDAGDSLSIHGGEKFTTRDVDNDRHEEYNCAEKFTGGWWYNKCHESNLNGQYLLGLNLDQFGKGVVWYKFRDHHYSLKYVHMAIRPVRRA